MPPLFNHSFYFQVLTGSHHAVGFCDECVKTTYIMQKQDMVICSSKLKQDEKVTMCVHLVVFVCGEATICKMSKV